jgi:hypothetical protein
MAKKLQLISIICNFDNLHKYFDKLLNVFTEQNIHLNLNFNSQQQYTS